MQSSALKVINRYFPSFTFSQSKDWVTFLLFKNQFPETCSDFIDIITLCGNFFLKLSNFAFIFPRILKYSSLEYFLFQIQYSALTRFTHPVQLEQFLHA